MDRTPAVAEARHDADVAAARLGIDWMERLPLLTPEITSAKDNAYMGLGVTPAFCKQLCYYPTAYWPPCQSD